MGPPYCIIAQMAFGAYLRTMRIPESRAAHAQRHGWIVLIRDTDMPAMGLTFSWRDLHSNPHRASWYDSEALHDRAEWPE